MRGIRPMKWAGSNTPWEIETLKGSQISDKPVSVLVFYRNGFEKFMLLTGKTHIVMPAIVVHISRP